VKPTLRTLLSDDLEDPKESATLTLAKLVIQYCAAVLLRFLLIVGSHIDVSIERILGIDCSRR
jgi:hypothetical protein